MASAALMRTYVNYYVPSHVTLLPCVVARSLNNIQMLSLMEWRHRISNSFNNA